MGDCFLKTLFHTNGLLWIWFYVLVVFYCLAVYKSLDQVTLHFPDLSHIDGYITFSSFVRYRWLHYIFLTCQISMAALHFPDLSDIDDYITFFWLVRYQWLHYIFLICQISSGHLCVGLRFLRTVSIDLSSAILLTCVLCLLF